MSLPCLHPATITSTITTTHPSVIRLHSHLGPPPNNYHHHHLFFFFSFVTSSILSHPFLAASPSSILCLLIHYFVFCLVSLSFFHPSSITHPLFISLPPFLFFFFFFVCLFYFCFVFLLLFSDVASLTASVHAPSGPVPAQTQFPWQQILPQLQVIYPYPSAPPHLPASPERLSFVYFFKPLVFHCVLHACCELLPVSRSVMCRSWF